VAAALEEGEMEAELSEMDAGACISRDDGRLGAAWQQSSAAVRGEQQHEQQRVPHSAFPHAAGGQSCIVAEAPGQDVGKGQPGRKPDAGDSPSQWCTGREASSAPGRQGMPCLPLERRADVSTAVAVPEARDEQPPRRDAAGPEPSGRPGPRDAAAHDGAGRRSANDAGGPVHAVMFSADSRWAGPAQRCSGRSAPRPLCNCWERRTAFERALALFPASDAGKRCCVNRFMAMSVGRWHGGGERHVRVCALAEGESCGYKLRPLAAVSAALPAGLGPSPYHDAALLQLMSIRWAAAAIPTSQCQLTRGVERCMALRLSAPKG
jgi:hypothetical protein